jgi:hypothetical protein
LRNGVTWAVITGPSRGSCFRCMTVSEPTEDHVDLDRGEYEAEDDQCLCRAPFAHLSVRCGAVLPLGEKVGKRKISDGVYLCMTSKG